MNFEVFRRDPKDNKESDRDQCRRYRKEMAQTQKEIETAQENKNSGDILDKLNKKLQKLRENFDKSCEALSADTAENLTSGTVKPMVVQLEGTEATEQQKSQTENVKEGIIKLNVDDKKADQKELEDLNKKDLKQAESEKKEEKTKKSSEEEKESIAKQSDKVSDIESTEWKKADAKQEEAKELGSKSTDREEKTFTEKETVTESKKKSES